MWISKDQHALWYIFRNFTIIILRIWRIINKFYKKKLSEFHLSTIINSLHTMELICWYFRQGWDYRARQVITLPRQLNRIPSVIIELILSLWNNEVNSRTGNSLLTVHYGLIKLSRFCKYIHCPRRFLCNLNLVKFHSSAGKLSRLAN